jgi:hypothetical protein
VEFEKRIRSEFHPLEGSFLVEIVYLPWKKIVIHDVIEHQNKQFFEWFMGEAIKQNEASPAVSWANGIAFAVGNFLETPKLVKEKLNGNLHYAIVNFTRIGQQVEFPVEVKGQRYSVRLSPTDNPDFQELTSWLKKWEKPKLVAQVSQGKS